MNFNYFPPENGISRNRRWRDFAHGKDYTKADSQSAVRGGPHAAEDECVLKRAVVHGEILQEQVFWPDSLTSVPSKMMEQIVLEVLLRQNNNEEDEILLNRIFLSVSFVANCEILAQDVSVFWEKAKPVTQQAALMT
ncbi:uncharacterized protein [Melanerpes formicivorus]|uniref:uncharacterized protein isoform X3 n=1 Tax=Melanerpes formicivorus TaxID=211600 RepID=UPI00358E37D3